MSRSGASSTASALKRPENLGEQIYSDLRMRLKRGEISSETRLVDVDLATTYGTSRMPVREALLRLVNEGYLVGTMRGFAVPELSVEDVQDIFEVRRQLEPHAAACAATEMDDAALARLAEAMAKARQALADEDPAAMIEANIDFRESWLGAIRNKRLTDTITRFADHAQVVRLMTLRDKAIRELVLAGLEGLYDAFRKKDGALAARRMKAFISNAERAFFKLTRPVRTRSPKIAPLTPGARKPA